MLEAMVKREPITLKIWGCHRIILWSFTPRWGEDSGSKQSFDWP